MKNKSNEINELLLKLRQELLKDYSILDFWDADITAIGIQIGKKLIYISTFNYNKTEKYNIIVEEYDTGKVIEEEKEISYNDLVEAINNI